MASSHASWCRKFLDDVVCTWSFLTSLLVAVSTGFISAALHILDRRFDGHIADGWAPDLQVFSVFLTFAFFVVAFRTTNAINRYTDAARYLHSLGAKWFDTASTLIAFCRVSEAPAAKVEMFQQVLVRLVAFLNALCLESLQNGGRCDQVGSGFRFELLGSMELDSETQDEIIRSEAKVECVFQIAQQLIVDAHKSGVLCIAPPILTRSFQELGGALIAYHEAKKLSFVPLPLAYKAITAAIKFSAAGFVPLMVAVLAKRPVSSFLLTFVGLFLLWFMNGVAEALDNPFRKHARSLDASSMQKELSMFLTQLLLQADRPPTTVVPLFSASMAVSSSEPGSLVMAKSTLLTWQSSRGLLPSFDSASPAGRREQRVAQRSTEAPPRGRGRQGRP